MILLREGLMIRIRGGERGEGQMMNMRAEERADSWMEKVFFPLLV